MFYTTKCVIRIPLLYLMKMFVMVEDEYKKNCNNKRNDWLNVDMTVKIKGYNITRRQLLEEVKGIMRLENAFGGDTKAAISSMLFFRDKWKTTKDQHQTTAVCIRVFFLLFFLS